MIDDIDREELNRSSTTYLPWYVSQDPTPKQWAFLTAPYPEILFGGQAGPGKTSALLMAATQYVDVPGYAAMLFRRTYQDLSLPGALIDRSHEWFEGKGVKWHEQTKRWEFPSGATITFGYIDSENDKYRYQGSELQFIGVDELTQLTESQYTYLFSRLRRLEGSDIPLRMRATSNPGGIGHQWVKLRFLDTHDPDRLFLPARLDENPHIDQVAYVESLNRLDPITREQLLHGNWEIVESGGFFEKQWFEIVTQIPVHECVWLRYWDLAASDPKPGSSPDWTVGGLVGLRDGVWYVADVQRIQANPGEVEALIRQTAIMDGPNVPIRMEQEPGSSGVNTIYHYRMRVLVGYDFDGIPSTGSKVERARPVAAAAHARNIKLYQGPWIRDFLDELHAFPQKGVHDDQVDMLSGAVRVLSAPQVTVMEYYQPVEISRY
jgi:predicted phage terminase large subunit-like protein